MSKRQTTTALGKEPDAKKARTGSVLIFLDLGDRKHVPFAPKIFGEISEKKWNVIDVELDEEYPELYLRGDNDISCPLERENFKIVIKESEEPERFATMRNLFVSEFKQDLTDVPRIRFADTGSD